jgi:hypothetical protein
VLLLSSILAAWGRSREEEAMEGGFNGRRGSGQPREKGVAAKRGGKGKRGGHPGFCGRKK